MTTIFYNIRPQLVRSFSSYSFKLAVVYSNALLLSIVQNAIFSTVLLYMNYYSLASSEDASSFVIASALWYLGHIVGNVAVTKVAIWYNHGASILFVSTVSACGLFFILSFPHSKPVFYTGYALFAVVQSSRIARIAILSKIVPPRHRTTALAMNAFTFCLGSILGPLIWLVVQTYKHDHQILWSTISINRFTINFILMIVIAITSGFSGKFFLSKLQRPTRNTNPDELALLSQNPRAPRADPFHDLSILPPVRVVLPDGTVETVNLKQFQLKIFFAFSGKLLTIMIIINVIF